MRFLNIDLKYFISLLLSIPAFGNTYAQLPGNPNIIDLRIDPSAAQGGYASQIIDKITFIPLESTSRSAFGSIDQLEVTDKYFIALDWQTNAILIFDKAGKFHAKIAGGEIGFSDSHHLVLFFFDKYSGLIQIPYRAYLLCFNLDGKLVKKTIQRNYGDRQVNITADKTASYSYRADKRHKDSTAYEIVIANESNILKKYLPYNLKFAGLQGMEILWSSHQNLYSYEDSSVYMVRPYNYNIYYLNPDTLYTAYRFIFPLANCLPLNFTTDSTLNNKRILYLRENPDIIYGLSNIYRIDDNLFFRVLGARGESYVYNLKSEHLICVDKISADALTYFLPLTDAPTGGVDFKNKGFLASDGRALYTSYSSLALFQQKEAAQQKEIKYPPGLSQYFLQKHNEKGNPVIIQISFKMAL